MNYPDAVRACAADGAVLAPATGLAFQTMISHFLLDEIYLKYNYTTTSLWVRVGGFAKSFPVDRWIMPDG
jgi:hypothetical protein